MGHYSMSVISQVVATLVSRERLREHFRTSLYTNAYYLVLTQGIGSLGGFVFWIIAARFYTTEAVGLAGAVIPAISLLAAISQLGLGYGLIRFLPGAGNKANQMMNSSFTIHFLAALVASLVFLFGLGLWSPALLILRSRPIYFAAFVLFTLAFSLISLFRSVFMAYRSSKFTSFISIIIRLSALPLLLLFMSFTGFMGIVGATGIAAIIALGITLFVLLPRTKPGYFPLPQISKEVVKEIIPYSIGNHAAQFIGTAVTWLLPLIVVNALGAEANAYFYIAWAVAQIAIVFPSSLSMSSFVESSNREEALWLNIRKALGMSLLLTIPLIALIIGFGDKLLLIFGREYSAEGTTTLWLLSLSAFPHIVVSFYVVYARVRKRLGIIIGVHAALVSIILASSYWLMPQLGIAGIGVAYLAGYTLVALGIIGLVLRKEPGRKLALLWRRG